VLNVFIINGSLPALTLLYVRSKVGS